MIYTDGTPTVASCGACPPSTADVLHEQAERTAAADRHPDRYVVIENTPGYLPEDDDPATFDDLDEARAYAQDLIDRIEEHYFEAGANDVLVDGDIATSLSVLVSSNFEHDLGRVVEIVEVK